MCFVSIARNTVAFPYFKLLVEQGVDIICACVIQMRYYSLFPGSPVILSHTSWTVIFSLTRKMHFGNNNGKLCQKETKKEKEKYIFLYYIY